MADAMIRSGQIKTCLVVAAEVKSRSVDPADGDTALLFGDGAGAVVLRGEPEAGQLSQGLLGLRLHADGAQHGLITIPAGGSRRPTTPETVEAKSHTLRMQGAPLFRLAVKRLDQVIREIVKEFGVDSTRCRAAGIAPSQRADSRTSSRSGLGSRRNGSVP